MHTLKLITRFYGKIFLANFLVSLSCVYLLGNYGDRAYEIIIVLFWYKVISIVLLFYMAVYYQKQELYYYQNLGISKLKLGITTSVFDFLFWLALILWQLLLGIPGYLFNLLLWTILLTHLYVYIKK
ncbi:MAG TPA: hypothetical protein VGI43_05865 [Mucilaginibacter sp.]|jgi:hypothetical protein